MICPKCWTKVTHMNQEELIEPEIPEEYKKPENLRAYDMYIMETYNAAHSNLFGREGVLRIAGKPKVFNYLCGSPVSILKNFRVRMQHQCENCEFVWDYFIGEENVETYKFTPEQKYWLLIIAIISFAVTSIICSAVWSYQWKCVRMAQNGLEQVETPYGHQGTTTEWRKVVPKEKE